MKHTLLVELLTEELPPKALAKLGDAFAAAMFQGLGARALLEPHAVATTYATPRRLAVSITGVRDISPDKAIREKVLPVSVALDKEGQPAAPLVKKLAALAQQTGRAQIALSELERAIDGKAESFFFSYTAAGEALAPGLQATLDESITKLPIPKLMSYQRPDGSTVQFVRPVHGLIALYGDAIVPVSLLGLAAGNQTLGHRFLSRQAALTIASPEQYADILEAQGKVIASVTAR